MNEPEQMDPNIFDLSDIADAFVCPWCRGAMSKLRDQVSPFPPEVLPTFRWLKQEMKAGRFSGMTQEAFRCSNCKHLLVGLVPLEIAVDMSWLADYFYTVPVV